MCVPVRLTLESFDETGPAHRDHCGSARGDSRCRAHFALVPTKTSVLQGSGTVEARNIRVGSKVGGRIDKVLVREGDNVKPGQV